MSRPREKPCFHGDGGLRSCFRGPAAAPLAPREHRRLPAAHQELVRQNRLPPPPHRHPLRVGGACRFSRHPEEGAGAKGSMGSNQRRRSFAEPARSFQELNRRLRAPVAAFFAHLCQVARPCLSGGDDQPDGGTQISLVRQDDGDLVVKLKSELAGLPFYWEFHCSPAPVTVVRSQFSLTEIQKSLLFQSWSR